MKEFKKITGTPDRFAPFEDKLKNEYGVKIGKLISGDWFDSSGFATGSCEFMTRRDYVRNKRLFVRGEQSVKALKDAYSPRDGALELVNLDFTNINWAEKFNRVVSGGISDENFKLDIRATDRYSSLQRQGKREYFTKYMASRGMLQKAVNQLGINLLPKESIPGDDKELEIQLEIKDRPRIEIAEEILIDYILSTNEWDFLNNQYNEDLVDVGLIVARVYLDKNDGVKLDYVDPEFYIHSKVYRKDFKGKYYEGYLDTITISEFSRESGITDVDYLRTIANIHNSKRDITWDSCSLDEIIDLKIDVLRFAYKTSKTIAYKKKSKNGKTIKLSKRSDTWEGSESTKVSKTLDTWLEGNYVLGSECVYGYKECENLYDDVMNKAMSPFITFAHKIYENRLQSFSTNIEAPARMLQRISNKIQHLVNELKPDGVAIDLDMLAELDDGKGGTKKAIWENALNIFEVKGVVFSKRIDMGDTGLKDKSAVTPMAYQQGTALVPLLNTWAHYYNLIREITGVNPARDGSMPADTLVGVNQLAQLASNTVTKDIVDTAVLFKKRICEVISSRIKSIYTYKDAAHLREIYTNVVGKTMMDAIEVLKNRHLHEFGFIYEMYPTIQEIQEFKDTLNMAVQEGFIDAYMKSQAVRIAKTNLKLATEFVGVQIKKAKKEKMQQEMMLAEHKSMNDAKAAQAAAQAELFTYGQKKKIDLDFKAQDIQLDLLKEQGSKQINLPYDEREFQQEAYLTKLKSATEWDTKKYLEESKNDRTAIQATQQSYLKYQSQTNGLPKDFSGENSWFEPSL